jgi:thiamine pyrophosphokinase
MKRSGKRAVIFSGGQLGQWALSEIRDNDMLIGADRGALFLVQQGYRPDVALGDFDSVSKDELRQIEACSKHFTACDPVMKDWTDTEMAVRFALQQEVSEILLCGVLGTRWDHSLANVHQLRQALDAGVDCRIVDAHNELTLLSGPSKHSVVKGRFSHVSLLPLSLEVRGITLLGFQYPLYEATLTLGQSLGISNVLLGSEGRITLREGLLLVIQSTDTAAKE